MPSLVQLREALMTANAAASDYQLDISCAIPIPPCLIDHADYPDLQFGFCKAGSDDAYYALESRGNVRPCNHSPTVLGNAWDEPMAAILSAGRMEPFRAARPSNCEPCSRKEECQGGCKAAAEVCYGRLDAEEPLLHLNHESVWKE